MYRKLLKEGRDRRDATRRYNLQRLIAKYGSARAFAAAVDRSPAQIGNILRGVKPFGDTIKKHIEQTLKLEAGYLDKPAKNALYTLTEPERKTTSVPLVSFVQAGLPTDQGDPDYDDFVDVYGEFSSDCFALRVTGDSMTPLIDEGDIVVVDPNRLPHPGDYIVARSELEHLNETTVKRYHPIGFDEEGREIFEARPLNDLYPSLHSVEQRLVIVGTICKLLKDL